MKVLVTGSDGLLGSNVVRELLKREHKVKAMIHRGKTNDTLEGLNIERFKGDLLNEEDVKEAVKDCDAVIHAGANTSIWPSRNKEQRSVNVKGTYHVLKAVHEGYIKRLVHVGTANTFSFGDKLTPGIEETPYIGSIYGLDYMDSKYKAHELVKEWVKEKGVPAIIVNPTFMIGPYDTTPSSGAMIKAIYKKKIPGFAPGGRNYISVKDAAIAIVNALKQGRVGESYILANENLSYQEAFTKIANVVGVTPPKRAIPSGATIIYGRFGNFKSRVTKKQPTVSFPMARIACDGHYFSGEKAVQELDLPQTPIEIAIKESFEWMKNNGYLDK